VADGEPLDLGSRDNRVRFPDLRLVTCRYRIVVLRDSRKVQTWVRFPISAFKEDRRCIMLKELLKKHREVGLLENPQFDKSRRCHDWRNYIPDELRLAWKDLSYEARIAVFVAAEKQAHKEDWD
jgi:hypothetical protein